MADRRARKRFKTNQIDGPFSARPIAMLQSPAYRVLSRAAHMVLARLEIEHAQHGGKENGRLPCTYEHFVEYGIHRHAIGPAIREASALGFTEVTQRGAAGNADLRRPSLYRLTYRHVDGVPGDGSHEWRNIVTIEEAERIAEAARKDVDKRAAAVAKKRKSSDGKRHVSVSETVTENETSPVSETVTTSPVAETVTTSIFSPGVAPSIQTAKVEPIRRQHARPARVADPEPGT